MKLTTKLPHSAFCRPTTFITNKRILLLKRSFATMPETLHKREVIGGEDPSVSKQYDAKTDKKTQFTDLYKIVDDTKFRMLTTHRPNIGAVSRSMALSKREGPDFYFLANINSQKFSDLNSSKEASISFQNNKSMDWVTIAGTAEVSTTSEKIAELHSKPIKAWFGDLGDGVHDGGPEDPRMAMIVVKPRYIAYYKTTVGTLGYMKEITQATVTGEVADTGVMRELDEGDIATARSYA